MQPYIKHTYSILLWSAHQSFHPLLLPPKAPLRSSSRPPACHFQPRRCTHKCVPHFTVLKRQCRGAIIESVKDNQSNHFYFQSAKSHLQASGNALEREPEWSLQGRHEKTVVGRKANPNKNVSLKKAFELCKLLLLMILVSYHLEKANTTWKREMQRQGAQRNENKWRCQFRFSFSYLKTN